MPSSAKRAEKTFRRVYRDSYGEQLESRTEFHLLPCALGPPMAYVKSTAGKQHRHTDGD